MYTILIADDEDMERDLIRFLLTRDFPNSFQLIEAPNGRDALHIIRQEKIDILLTDVQMPFLTGIELARESRKFLPDMEILFFSGFDDFEYVQSALVLRAVNYILKPVNPEHFRQAVSDILTRLNSNKIAFAKSAEYYSHSFFDDSVSPAESSLNVALPSDKELLHRISAAISLRDTEQLTDLVHELMSRYLAPPTRSPAYIRHISISLLQMLITAIPSLSDADFEATAEEIYTLRYFSDIKETILKHLKMLTDSISAEMDGACHSVYLVKQYIAEHYSEDLTLNLLAEQVYLSPNYLSNTFTRVTGCSLNKYIRLFRMKKAKELLTDSNLKIVDISKAVGYPTPSYFIKTFQAQYGMTPNCYREKNIPDISKKTNPLEE